MFKRGSLSLIAAAAVLLALSAPATMAAPSPGIDPPPVTVKPRPCAQSVASGQPVSAKLGEVVCVRSTPQPQFVAQPHSKSDEAKLADWLMKASGKKLTFEAVQAYIKAENLSIPTDILTSIKNGLEGTGNTPGPSATPGINRRIFLYSFYEVGAWQHEDLGECGIPVGVVGSGRNNSPYPGDVQVQIYKLAQSSANMKVGVSTGEISAEVGYDVTRSTIVITSYTARDIPRGGSVRVYGTSMGNCTLYGYNRYKYDMYFDTETRTAERSFNSFHYYSGMAFNYGWMDLEAR